MKENWEGYMVNTISVDYIKHIVCMREDDASMSQKKFIVKPESTLCSVRLSRLE